MRIALFTHAAPRVSYCRNSIHTRKIALACTIQHSNTQRHPRVSGTGIHARTGTSLLHHEKTLPPPSIMHGSINPHYNLQITIYARIELAFIHEAPRVLELAFTHATPGVLELAVTPAATPVCRSTRANQRVCKARITYGQPPACVELGFTHTPV